MPLVELIFMFFFIWSSSSLSFHHLVTFHSLLTHCLCHSPSWLLLISSLCLCVFPKFHFSFLFFSFLTNDRNPGLISSRRCTRSPSQPRVQAACHSGSSLQSEKKTICSQYFGVKILQDTASSQALVSTKPNHIQLLNNQILWEDQNGTNH